MRDLVHLRTEIWFYRPGPATLNHFSCGWNSRGEYGGKAKSGTAAGLSFRGSMRRPAWAWSWLWSFRPRYHAAILA